MRTRREVERFSDPKAATSRSKPRGRGLGPFSGGQLTAIVITVVIVVGFPIGAFATLRFSNVAITDPHGTYRAAVDAGGQIAVNPADPVYKTQTRVTGDGQLRVNAMPVHQYNNLTTEGGDVFVNAGTPLAELFATTTAQRFSITSLTFTDVGGVAAQVMVIHYVSRTGITLDCINLAGNAAAGERMRFDIPANQTVHVAFPTPLTWSVTKGHKDCSDVELLDGSPDASVDVMVNGFIGN